LFENEFFTHVEHHFLKIAMKPRLHRTWSRLASVIAPAIAITLLCLSNTGTISFAQSAKPDAKRVPSVDELIALKSVGSPKISPDGKFIAYTQTETDFKQDAYVTHLWLLNVASGRVIQLTRGEKSCGQHEWSPDGAWLSFTSTRAGDKSQLFAIRPDGGEAVQLTKSEQGVGGYEWSPDGKHIAYTSTDAPSKPMKDRKELMSDFDVVRREYSHSHIWTFAFDDALGTATTGTQRTRNADKLGDKLNFSVGSIAWSPDGKQIAFSATANPDIIQGETNDIYLLTLADTSVGAVRKVVAQAGPDLNPIWSPDGKQLAFASYMGNTKFYHANSKIAVVSIQNGTAASPVKSLTDGFDEQVNPIAWKADGIYFLASQKTNAHLFRLNPQSGAITRLSQPESLVLGGASLSKDGSQAAFTLASPSSLPEICTSPLSKFSPKILTTMTAQAAPLLLGSREVVSWKSKDSTLIEGVLIKPADFDPKKKYALLCVIHGGPTAVDRPILLAPDARYYPADIWAAKGALVLKVNYRGSAGYGEKFRQLNVRNLGVGDAWDVLSGVDFLVGKGWVDTARMGCMGWSQGGYISAFLTTHTSRFKALSVGAGISNWATYYYNTDITPFTIQYLSADPAADPEIYKLTSPMTTIKDARTPTLIQHGENDRRVPIANAYELRQGLEDRGVPVEMVVYKGFGHGITKPKSMRAVMQHNLAWFNHYVLGEPMKNLSLLDSAKKDEKKEEKK
jgi:dipeptidyl aminopeptidase/acylaminoacyl peptidase